MKEQEGYAAGLDSRLSALAEPLLEELGGIEARLAEVEAERESLLSAKRRIQRVVDGLANTPKKTGPKKRYASGTYGDRRSPDDSPLVQQKWEERIARVQQFIETHPSEDGFIASRISREISANGDDPISGGKVKTCLEELRDRGVLRVDRKVVGGGFAYKLVGS